MKWGKELQWDVFRSHVLEGLKVLLGTVLFFGCFIDFEVVKTFLGKTEFGVILDNEVK